LTAKKVAVFAIIKCHEHSNNKKSLAIYASDFIFLN